MTKNTTKKKNHDARFQRWLKSNPGGSFSEFFDQYHVPQIIEGGQHASLGRNLSTGDWKTSGRGSYNSVLRVYTELNGGHPLPPDARVCEIGCGTLRIGSHFINHLNPGNFSGLDISKSLIEDGRQAYSDLLTEKKAVLGTFEEAFDAAVAMAPDLIFAYNVACHIHPDEERTFYSRLHQLAHKKGSRVIMQVLVHPTSVRYQESGWAHPAHYYMDKMRPLEFTMHTQQFIKNVKKAPHTLASRILAFQRTQKSSVMDLLPRFRR